MNHILIRTSLQTLAACFLTLGAASAATIPITEFNVTASNAEPAGITSGPDGALWFSELNSNNIGRMTTAGTVTKEYSVGTSLFTVLPAGIVTGPDGNLWFTAVNGNQIGRLTTTGTVTLFSVPTANSGPADIVVGPDGNLWFTELYGNKIGRVTTTGTFKEFTVPTAKATPAGIALGPDGNLWFAEFSTAKIGRVTTAGVFDEFALPDASESPEPAKITAGPDGNLWFTELNGQNIGRVTPTGVIKDFPTPTPLASGAVITSGPDGNLWFTELEANNVAKVTTAGVITEYPVPSANAAPAGITVGPDGNLWFTEIDANKVGRITLASSGTCTANATTLCIDDKAGDKRWQIGVTYKTVESGGLAGSGQAIPLTSLGVSEGGLFWFFSGDNPEMLIKVIDACALNQHFWVFYSATTNAGFTVTVKDTKTSSSKSYTNKDETAAPPIQDTAAFACNASGDETPDALASVDDGVRALRPSTADAAPEALNGIVGAAARDVSVPATSTTCTANSTTLCINGRFQIKASFKTTQGGGSSGQGNAIALTSLNVAQGGLLWFFAADNPEMLVKVINGCGLNEQYWVFYAAGTNVGFTVTVTDLQTGSSKVYTNKDGVAALPVQDTSALPCAK